MATIERTRTTTRWVAVVDWRGEVDAVEVDVEIGEQTLAVTSEGASHVNALGHIRQFHKDDKRFYLTRAAALGALLVKTGADIEAIRAEEHVLQQRLDVISQMLTGGPT